ncbi:hypothetical protein J1605_006764 [Eschrichtius robustus]|uniref:RING-type E3 ubiquitin transferase n=1 Tax=Eschrichtius robustus TaxID=9764 RepID=A0AB34H2F1_ESCRO|nr:hypothetical protein J1605_006764 [Eschrichtius robustus]
MAKACVAFGSALEGHPVARTLSEDSCLSHGRKGFKCPICSKSVASDEMEMHFIMCLSKPRLSYNDDVLTKDAGECVICLEELLQGDTIARLPCLCIYHKRYERAGRASFAAPQTPEGSFPVGEPVVGVASLWGLEAGRGAELLSRHPCPASPGQEGSGERGASQQQGFRGVGSVPRKGESPDSHVARKNLLGRGRPEPQVPLPGLSEMHAAGLGPDGARLTSYGPHRDSQAPVPERRLRTLGQS